MAEQTQNISIVIPAYNEERRLPESLRHISAFFSKWPADSVEIIAVIERSKDRTLELAREAVRDDPKFQIVDNLVQRGKGYAVKSGMLRARGQFVFFMDADLSTPLSEILKFVAHFSDHPETGVVIGSRADQKSKILKRQKWFRQTLGRAFNSFVQLFGIRGIKDTQCGFKAFRASAAAAIFPLQTISGFAFDVEVLLLASKLGIKIDTLPVVWVNSPDSKVRILIDPVKMLWDLIKIRWLVRRSIRGKAVELKLSFLLLPWLRRLFGPKPILDSRLSPSAAPFR